MTRNKEEERQAKQQTVKLKKYTVTPFKGEYKDWLKFWNQFTVKELMDQVSQTIANSITCWNWYLENLKDDILGLPHTEDGCNEGKRILERTYGKDIKIHKALIKELENLNAISSVHELKRVHEYYNKLSRIVRTLVTMKKLHTAQSYVYTLTDKLGSVKETLVQKDDDWEEWNLDQLVENLRKYIDRNLLPITEVTIPLEQNYPVRKRANDGFQSWRERDKMVLASTAEKSPGKPNSCAYCGFSNHRSIDCQKVMDLAPLREILKRKNLCFNCTVFGHTAARCRTRGGRRYNRRHHTSLCDGTSTNSEGNKMESPKMGKRAIDISTTLHATVVAKVNDIPARIMMNSGAGSSYICTSLLTKLKIKPTRVETRSIEQIYGTVKRRG